MTEPTGKGVIHRGTQKNVQFICCSVPGCTETMNVPIKGTVKPGDVILNMARRRGWNIEGDGRKVRICPKHKEPKMAQKNPDLVAASQTLVPLSESLKLPTDAARAQRRRVFHIQPHIPRPPGQHRQRRPGRLLSAGAAAQHCGGVLQTAGTENIQQTAQQGEAQRQNGV